MSCFEFTPFWKHLVLDSVWNFPSETRILWITMLALKDKKNIVRASIPMLAVHAQITVEQCRKSLELLSQADEFNACVANEGRRICKVERGWKIIDGEFYQDLITSGRRTEYFRNYMAAKRKAKKDKDVVEPDPVSS